MITRSIRNLLTFGPYGHAEDLVRQIQMPWEVKGIIQRITVKERKWRNQTIIQGFQVHMRDGVSRACGMNYNDPFNTVTLIVPNDRFISQVRIASASYIHSLSLVLDNGEILGPVGEIGKANVTTIPDENHPVKTMLTGVSGVSAQSEKLPVIAQVYFSFNTDCL